jgi:hypothetical protein
MISLSDVLKHIIVRRPDIPSERILITYNQQGNVDIGGGGVGAVPVEAVLAAEAQARKAQASQ